MAADREIICTNKDGNDLVLTEKEFNPFLLVKVDGIYDSDYEVNVSSNTTTDGGTYQGSTAKIRNIVLTLKDINETTTGTPDYDVYINMAVIKGKTLEILSTTDVGSSPTGKDFSDHRKILDKIFKKNETGRLTFREGDEERVIDYYVEYVRSTGTHSTRLHTVSLLCPDPFFYEPNDTVVSLSELYPDFEFIHEFLSTGEELGHSMGTYGVINNDGANENIGLTIYVTGTAEIENPVITHIEKSQFIQIGDENEPFTLPIGDTLIITTGIGNKHVYWVHGETTTEINYKIANGSTYIQLKRGVNTIAYNASAGKYSMLVQALYRLQYARA